jgi:hypothetical protein
VGKDKKIWEQVSFNILLSADRKIKVQRESPATERGSVKHTTFSIDCDVSALLVFEGDFETGRIKLRLRDIERWGSSEYMLYPEAITEAALEEFAGATSGPSPRRGCPWACR